MYDYALGGHHNTAVDRKAANESYRMVPNAVHVAMSNRHFLRRVVRMCTDRGIDQFLDLGSGIPTVGNVHEVAHRNAPSSRVAYVDLEPVAVSHTRNILREDSRVLMVQADIRDPERVLREAAELLDFSRPVALLMVAVLHYVSHDDEPLGMLARYRAALPSGSVLAISHTTDERDPEGSRRLRELLADTETPITHRGRTEVEELFTGTVLVEPGVVWTPQWRPEDDEDTERDPADSETWCGAAIIS